MEIAFRKQIASLGTSSVREILKLTQNSSTISFAGGLPAEEFLPVEMIGKAFESAINSGPKSLQYGLTEGYSPLRQYILEPMPKKGNQLTLDNILLTTGSQQSIDLMARTFIDDHDVILVETPTYLAALKAFHLQNARVIPVDSDEFGMDIEDLRNKVDQYNPKFIYVNPNFSNPTGRVWSLDRRTSVLDICRSNDVLILEDDPYGELFFHNKAPYPAIFSLDDENSHVIYTSTFSKIVAPALRTGWVIGDSRIIDAMKRIKQASDLHSSSIDQQALYHLLTDFDLEAHIKKLRVEYENRVHVMTELLDQFHVPVKWTMPEGGMFLWVELPEEWNTEKLLNHAVQQGVAFVPGAEFYAESPQKNFLRLNFSYNDEEKIKLGMRRLMIAADAYKSQKH